MGATSSKSSDINLKGVFGKELEYLNSVCYSIINKDTSKFNKKKYNMFMNELYDNHVMILEKNLNKHLKIDLEKLNSSLYFVPKYQEDIVDFESKDGMFSKKNNQFIKKSELSKMISNHYGTVLKMVNMITQVYDLENGGNYSIAGIVKRNISMENGLLVVNYCNMNQFDYDKNKRVEKVNFGNLKGIKILTSLMSKDEARAFTKHIGILLNGKMEESKLEKSICENNLLHNTKDFSDLYKNRRGINIDCSNHKYYSDADSYDLFLTVSKENPILSSKKCLDKKKVIINLNDKSISKQSKKLHKLYDTFTNNYEHNIKNVLSNIHDVLDFKKGLDIDIKDIGNLDLQASLQKLKVHIMKFYINSIIDYQNLLKQAKHVGSINVNKNNL